MLHLLGAERASCAIIALDTPGANYRAVYAMTTVWIWCGWRGGGGYRAVYAMTKVWMGSVKCMILLEGCEDRVLGGAEPPFLTWF